MIYTIYGYGKGKTEASIGMTVRALANHEDVTFAQFLKSGDSSEVNFLNQYFNFNYCGTLTTGLTYTDKDIQACKELIQNLMKHTCNLIVADEILVAYDMGFISLKEIKELVKFCKEYGIDLCMTGRLNSKDKRLNIVMLSDIVTNAYAVKHWFNSYCPECKCEYEYFYKYCPKCGSRLQESKPSKKGRDF